MAQSVGSRAQSIDEKQWFSRGRIHLFLAGLPAQEQAVQRALQAADTHEGAQRGEAEQVSRKCHLFSLGVQRTFSPQRQVSRLAEKTTRHTCTCPRRCILCDARDFLRGHARLPI